VTLLTLLEKLIKTTNKQTDGFSGMGVPHKLLSEEKVTFEFVENLNEIVSLDRQAHLEYLRFLLSFGHYDRNEPHTEAFVRRIFSIINNIIIQSRVPSSILQEVLPLLFERIEELIDLRYDNENCMALIFPSKGPQSLFFTIGLYAMQISSFLINPVQFKQRMTVHFN